MARETFQTTLETQAKADLKLIAAIERRDMNDVLEELIQKRKQELAPALKEAL